MVKKIIRTTLVMLSFFILELLLGMPVLGSFAKILIPIYGLSLVKRRDDLALKTMFWFLIVFVPIVLLATIVF